MTPIRPIELWGGLECTINRVGDRYIDQLERSGHYARLDDLEAIAGLGIRTLRYPALWEHVAPTGVARADWTSCDAALARLQRLGIEPVVGLVHHGSGPIGTDLLDPSFAPGLSEYASAFAERYPWVRRYTPINEPLTTARFAALYGHWYPHRRDDRSFVAALLNQCDAIAGAMAAIRRRVPDAELVQTEDAGSTRSTPQVAAQAAFESERRWLSFDLLTGRMTRQHPLWGYLCRAGAEVRRLDRLQTQGVQPAILGLNYYVTSDRFLDHRLDRHPPSTHGGNGSQRYADVDAARSPGVGIRGHAAVLKEAWARYRLPVALTETHLGCTREEQLRWLADAWSGAQEAAACGVDARAVTVWALLGSWDWDSLVTRDDNHYEPGAFDVRNHVRRPTAVARVVCDLAAGRTPLHPVLQVGGWWRRVAGPTSVAAPRILIAGASGTLGRAFTRACDARGLAQVALSHGELDITSPESMRAAIARWRPWAVVNAAGDVRVDDAEREPARCRRVNAVGAAIVAAVCRKAGIRLLTFSSDLVFDGMQTRPYVESDPVNPLNVYGRTKLEGERRVLALDPSALVVRTSAFFGPWDRHNFVTRALATVEAGGRFRAASDMIVSPTYVPDLVDCSLDLLIDGESGVWHLANEGAVTWTDFARMAAVAAHLDPDAIHSCESKDLGLRACRPSYSVLGTERGLHLPALEDSLSRYVRERETLWTAA
jgi:dTDP-4-dehydrorhamnose reductase